MKKKKQDQLRCCIDSNYGNPGCDKYDDRKDLLQKIVDGQANKDEQFMYDSIISQCDGCKCRQYCEQELAIKNLIQTKLNRKRVPLDIYDKINERINKIT